MLCTVKKTFEAARDTGNFLIAQVKANQQILHETLDAICTAEPPTDSAESVERNRHGRQEHRVLETFDVAGRLGADWDGLIVTAARVTRLTWHKNTKTGLWRQTNEISVYACQIRLSATAAGAAIRQHWSIENRSHYVRDVSFFEDLSRIRTKTGALRPVPLLRPQRPPRQRHHQRRPRALHQRPQSAQRPVISCNLKRTEQPWLSTGQRRKYG